jgi:hypothetical protein
MRERREGGGRVIRTVEGTGPEDVIVRVNSGRPDRSAHFLRMYVPGTLQLFFPLTVAVEAGCVKVFYTRLAMCR